VLEELVVPKLHTDLLWEAKLGDLVGKSYTLLVNGRYLGVDGWVEARVLVFFGFLYGAFEVLGRNPDNSHVVNEGRVLGIILGEVAPELLIHVHLFLKETLHLRILPLHSSL